MIFAMSPDFENILLLKKPSTHHNPLFRDKWTAPGGMVEDFDDSERECAIREFREETGLEIAVSDLATVLRFRCNCDPTEDEHEIFVYGCSLPFELLRQSQGDATEPTQVWPLSKLPRNALWYLGPILELVMARMRQRV